MNEHHKSPQGLPAKSGQATKSNWRNRWPLKAKTCSPLTWWRQLPPDAFGEPERLRLLNTTAGLGVLRGCADIAAALRGDATAAIDAALHLMPVNKITLPVDITMTALVCAALDDNASAALVMAQIIGLSYLGHEREVELAASWLAYGRQCSAEPDKFGDAEAVLMAAFEEIRRKSHGG